MSSPTANFVFYVPLFVYYSVTAFELRIKIFILLNCYIFNINLM